MAIPPFMVSTAAGEMLAQRMVDAAWTSWRQDDVKAEWKKDLPTTGLLDVQRRFFRMRRGARSARRCACCGGDCQKKCSQCLTTHYCSQACQRRHWPEHKDQCQQPIPKIHRHLALAIPDFRCCWHYQAWLTSRTSDHQSLSVAIINRDTFVEIFGEDSLPRTLLNLAIHGRPSCFLCNIFAAHRLGQGAGEQHPELGRTHAPGSASVNAQELAEVHADREDVLEEPIETPAGASVAAERGAASQEAADTLGDEAMVANQTEKQSEGELRETHVEPNPASSRAAASMDDGGQVDVVLAQGAVDTETWSDVDAPASGSVGPPASPGCFSTLD